MNARIGTKIGMLGGRVAAVGIACAAVCALVSIPGAGASSEDVQMLLAQKRCDACHSIDAALIGPAYRLIALRHAADKEAMVEVLARKIVLGGGGNWGVVPMVPNEHVTLDEARAMSSWILGLAPR